MILEVTPGPQGYSRYTVKRGACWWPQWAQNKLKYQRWRRQWRVSGDYRQHYVTDTTEGKVHTPRTQRCFTHAEVPGPTELLWQFCWVAREHSGIYQGNLQWALWRWLPNRRFSNSDTTNHRIKKKKKIVWVGELFLLNKCSHFFLSLFLSNSITTISRTTICMLLYCVGSFQSSWDYLKCTDEAC